MDLNGTKKVIAYIGVGSNLGDRAANISMAQDWLTFGGKAEVLKQAPIIETVPVGGPPQEKFLNTAWEVATSFSPKDLLEHLLDIEKKLWRDRTVKNGPRTIDLDILFYGDEIICEENLFIPHPRLHEREFVLEPLREIAPDFVHPILEKPIRELHEALAEAGDSFILTGSQS